MTVVGYGATLYNDALYGSDPYATGTEIRCGLLARVVRSYSPSPPIQDTIIEGLVDRFNYLQQGLQIMTAMNKIEFARGKALVSAGDVLNLDDVWGKLYECPRTTGETDDNYRRRLQTKIKVLNGSGTTANVKAVLDHLVAAPGATEIESRWPGRAIISFNTISAMLRAKANLSTLNMVLPDLFAAGVSYVVSLPIIESAMTAIVEGDRALDIALRSAIATDNLLSVGLDAIIMFAASVPDIELLAAIEGNVTRLIQLNTAISVDITTSCGLFGAAEAEVNMATTLRAALEGDPDQIETLLKSAVQGARVLEIPLRAAASKSFMVRSKLLACCALSGYIDNEMRAAVCCNVVLQCGMRARIARRVL